MSSLSHAVPTSPRGGDKNEPLACAEPCTVVNVQGLTPAKNRNPLTPDQLFGRPQRTRVGNIQKNDISGSSSASSFIDTTSSRSDDEDHGGSVQKDLTGLFEDISVGGTARLSRPSHLHSSSSDEESVGRKLWKADDRKEPILMDNDERFCLLPVKYHKAYEYYKMAQASYWTVEEVDLSQDKRDWDKLTKQEKHFISYVLAFFAASDGIVLENLAVRFMQGTEYACECAACLPACLAACQTG
jgi:hypothetical protein